MADRDNVKTAFALHKAIAYGVDPRFSVPKQVRNIMLMIRLVFDSLIISSSIYLPIFSFLSGSVV